MMMKHCHYFPSYSKIRHIYSFPVSQKYRYHRDINGKIPKCVQEFSGGLGYGSQAIELFRDVASLFYTAESSHVSSIIKGKGFNYLDYRMSWIQYCDMELDYFKTFALESLPFAIGLDPSLEVQYKKLLDGFFHSGKISHVNGRELFSDGSGHVYAMALLVEKKLPKLGLS